MRIQLEKSQRASIVPLTPPQKKIQFGRLLEYNYEATLITSSVGVAVMSRAARQLPLHSNFVSWSTISPPSPKQLEANPIIAQDLFSRWCILTKDVFWSSIHSVALLYLHRKRLWPFQTIRLHILTGGTEPGPPTRGHRRPHTVLLRRAVLRVL